MIPLDGRAHRVDQLLAASPILALSPRGVAELNAGFGRQLLDGGDEIDVLDLLHEREDITRCTTSEALVASGLLTDVERGTSLGMKRTQADPVAADASQCDVLLHDIGNRNGGPKLFEIFFDNRHSREVTGGVSPLVGRWKLLGDLDSVAARSLQRERH